MFCIWFRQLTHLLRPLTVCSGCSCTRSGCSSFAQLLTRRLRLLTNWLRLLTSWLRLLSRQLRRLTVLRLLNCQLRWARLLLCQPTTRFSLLAPQPKNKTRERTCHSRWRGPISVPSQKYICERTCRSAVWLDRPTIRWCLSPAICNLPEFPSP